MYNNNMRQLSIPESEMNGALRAYAGSTQVCTTSEAKRKFAAHSGADIAMLLTPVVRHGITAFTCTVNTMFLDTRNLETAIAEATDADDDGDYPIWFEGEEWLMCRPESVIISYA